MPTLPKTKKKPEPKGASGATKRVHRKYAPGLPVDLLDSMIEATHAHILRGTPIPQDLAIQIYRLVVRTRSGPLKPTRAAPENLEAAALARDMHRFLHCPIEIAIAAAFPDGTDPEDLRRNYYKLLANPHIRGADIPKALAAYQKAGSRRPL